MRIVVTGATSMIGVALIQECIANGDTVLAIVRENTNRIKRLPKSDLIQIEYADLDTLNHVQGDGHAYDVFYHIAWGHTAKAERDYPIAQENNIRTTLAAVELANKLGCKKFIGAGSQAEYGNCEGLITEETIPYPVTSYGMAKLSANMLSRRLCEQLGIIHIWTRIFSVYGCNDNEGTMLNYAIDQFIKGEQASFSAATQIWNYLYESDAGRMFYLLGATDIEAGIYHIASNDSRRLRKFIMEMASLFDKPDFQFAEQNGIEVYGIEPSVEKTYSAIGFKPSVSFKDGINKVIDYRKTIGV